MSEPEDLPALAPTPRLRMRIEAAVGPEVAYVHRIDEVNGQKKMRIGVHSDAFNKEIVVNGIRPPGLYWSTIADEAEAL